MVLVLKYMVSGGDGWGGGEIWEGGLCGRWGLFFPVLNLGSGVRGGVVRVRVKGTWLDSTDGKAPLFPPGDPGSSPKPDSAKKGGGGNKKPFGP